MLSLRAQRIPCWGRKMDIDRYRRIGTYSQLSRQIEQIEVYIEPAIYLRECEAAWTSLNPQPIPGPRGGVGPDSSPEAASWGYLAWDALPCAQAKGATAPWAWGPRVFVGPSRLGWHM